MTHTPLNATTTARPIPGLWAVAPREYTVGARIRLFNGEASARAAAGSDDCVWAYCGETVPRPTRSPATVYVIVDKNTEVFVAVAATLERAHEFMQGTGWKHHGKIIEATIARDGMAELTFGV